MSWSLVWPFQWDQQGFRCSSSSHQAWQRPWCQSLGHMRKRERKVKYIFVLTGTHFIYPISIYSPMSSPPPSSSFLFLAFCCKTKQDIYSAQRRYPSKLVIQLQIGASPLLVHHAGLRAGWGLAPSGLSPSGSPSAQWCLWMDPGGKRILTAYKFGSVTLPNQTP